MTTTNTTPMHSASQFFRYMAEVESHNGIDPRYVMSMTRGPISMGSFRTDFARLMGDKNRRVESIATLHSAAPGECDMIARLIEKEQGLDAGSLDEHDPEVVEWYMKRVLEAEERSAPGTAGVYVAQIDGKSGLLHVHGQRLNVMVRDVEVSVMRREYETESVPRLDAQGKPVMKLVDKGEGQVVSEQVIDEVIKRDAQGKRIPKRNADGKIVYEQTVERVKAGQALPPSMRDSFRAREMVNAVWLEHGIDNVALVNARSRRGAQRAAGHTYEDRARAYLDALEANRTKAMTVEDLVEAIEADGHGARLRGKKKPGLTFDFVEANGAHHEIRTQRLSTPERDYTLAALIERMGTEPVTETPVVVPATSGFDMDAFMRNFEAATADITPDEAAIRAKHAADHEKRLAENPLYRRVHESRTRHASTVEPTPTAARVEDEHEDAPRTVTPPEIVVAVPEVESIPTVEDEIERDQGLDMEELRRWYAERETEIQNLLAMPGMDEDDVEWYAGVQETLRDDLAAVEAATAPGSGQDAASLSEGRWERLNAQIGSDARERWSEEREAERRRKRAQRQSVVVEQVHEVAQETRGARHDAETPGPMSNEVEREFKAEVARINGQTKAEKVIEDAKAEAKPLSQVDRELARQKRRIQARKEAERRAQDVNGQSQSR